MAHVIEAVMASLVDEILLFLLACMDCKVRFGVSS